MNWDFPTKKNRDGMSEPPRRNFSVPMRPTLEIVKGEKMSAGFLSNVTTGKCAGPQIHVVAGNNGVGKTTWAASFPSPLVLDLENGSNHLDVARIASEKIPTLASLRALLKELNDSPHGFKTIVVDSVESLEGLISDGVCAEGSVASIELYEGGYGKGFTRTREIMREVFSDLRLLQAKGMTIILVAHTQVKTHNDPATNQSYDRIIMRCNDKMAALIRDLSDNVFFVTYRVFTEKEKGKVKAYGDGQRVMFTQWRPGFDAKNRLELPHELPLSYDAFVEACEQKPEVDAKVLIVEIKEMASGLDEKMKKTVAEQVEKFKANPTKLKEVKTRLMKYVTA